jgi:predicted ATPase
MVRIKNVRTQRFSATFELGRTSSDNQVDLITGVNGSGKTELLTTLAEYFRGSGAKAGGPRIDWEMDGGVYSSYATNKNTATPERTIAQTFSPFSRFPAPADDTLTLTDIYSEGREREESYRAVGLHKRSKYIGSVLSRHTLEQGIYRLSEEPNHIEPLAMVLNELSFSDEIRLEYRSLPPLPELVEASRPADYLANILKQPVPPDARSLSPFRRAIEREVRSAGSVGSLADLIEGALDLVKPRLRGNRIQHSFALARRKSSEEFAVLQALALLRRLRLLRLTECNLSALDGTSIDLAVASSGQQQMLCSIFGLVAELKSGSLILVDEPELSLHPNWQTAYLDRVYAVLRPFHGCHVIIATHSPLIVQRAQELRCGIVSLEQGESRSQRRDDPVSVEETLVEVFKTPVRSSVYLANELFSIVSSYEESDTQLVRTQSMAKLEELRDTYMLPQSDPQDKQLIADAFSLLQAADDDKADDDEVGD